MNRKNLLRVGQTISFYAYTRGSIVPDLLSGEPIPFALILIVLCGSASSGSVPISSG